MISKENNFAYIDGANLYKGVAGLLKRTDAPITYLNDVRSFFKKP